MKINITRKRIIVPIFSIGLVIASIVQLVTPQFNTAAASQEWNSGTISQVSSGFGHNCAVAGGKAYCWGLNQYGQLGVGSTDTSPYPLPVDTTDALAGKTITSVASGKYSSCAITSEQKAYCWGKNTEGQLGDGTTTNQLKPIQIGMTGALAGKSITALSIGTYKYNGSDADVTCAIADGKAYCWGNNFTGQLGNGTTINSSDPVAVDTSGVLAGKTIASIDVSRTHTCALTTDGVVACWGANPNGELGNGTSGPTVTSPVAVVASGALAGKTVTALSVMDYGACVIASSKPYCWGENSAGQLGDGTMINSDSPTAVSVSGALNGKTITSIAGGEMYACASSADNKQYCWGKNNDGQLGSGTNANSSIPVDITNVGVLSGKTITSLSAGTVHACATDGSRVYCWGSNQYYQLGDGSENSTSTASAVLTNIPEVNSLTPDTLTIDGQSHEVTITGKRISSKAVVTIGDETLTGKDHARSYIGSEITVVVPTSDDLEAGAVDVTVVDPEGGSTTLPQALTFDQVAAPTISSVSPNSYDVYKDQSIGNVTINGTGFQEGVTVMVGQIAAEVTSVAENLISITIPTVGISQSKSVDVTVTNPDGQTTTAINGFSFIVHSPHDIQITPSTGYVSDTLHQITIRGDELSDSFMQPKLFVGGVEGTYKHSLIYSPDGGVTTVTDYVYDVAIGSTAGAYDVEVESNYGFRTTIANGYTVMPVPEKKITSVAFSTEADKKIMTIQGTGLVGATDPLEYQQAISNDVPFVKINGSQLNFCADGTGYDASELEGFGITWASDAAPCYYLMNAAFQPLINQTEAKVWLDDSFDMTAQGTVSVNGSSIYTYNQQTNPGNGTEEPTVKVDNRSLDGTPIISKRPTFSGTAEPGAIVTVTVRSDPITCTATADSNGNWSCTLPSDLPAGNHTVTVNVTNPDGSTEQLGPYAVVVQANTSGSTAISNTTPLAPNSGFQRSVSAAAGSLFLAISGLISIGVLCFTGIRTLRQKRA